MYKLFAMRTLELNPTKATYKKLNCSSFLNAIFAHISVLNELLSHVFNEISFWRVCWLIHKRNALALKQSLSYLSIENGCVFLMKYKMSFTMAIGKHYKNLP